MRQISGAGIPGPALLLAGLAVCQGWYLLIPPPGSYAVVDNQAPFAKWAAVSAYDTREACEAARVRAAEWGQQQRRWEPSLEAYAYAQCITSDDPRLW